MTEPRKHWYFITEEFCPACMASRTYRERRYTPRPTLWWERHESMEVYDYCD